MTENKPMIYILAPGEGVCVGGRFHGWLMRRHQSGEWVSVRELQAIDPMAPAYNFPLFNPRQGR